MKSRLILVVSLVALLALGLGWWLGRQSAAVAGAGTTAGTERRVKFYQSPMHPWITSDRPGNCTICGMALAPVYEGEAGFEASGDVVTLQGATGSVIGIETAPVRRTGLTRTLRLTGIVDDDDTRHHFVSSWTMARIERLFVDEIGEAVRAGAPLAEVYSRDLLVARQEYHALARQPDAAAPLLAGSRAKLRQLGLLDQQIDELAENDEVPTNTLLLAPSDGVVIERSETAYVGGYVEAGMPLFTLADFSRMWVQLDVYEPDLALIRPGQNVKLSIPSRPGEPLVAPISFIDPNLDPTTRTARARVVVDNDDRRLLHRQTVAAEVTVDLGETLVVPRSAVLFTREEPVAFVARGGEAYAPHPLRLGRVGDQGYEVLEGLREGDLVVTRSALLLEGQAQIAHGGSSPGHDHADHGGAPDDGPPPEAGDAEELEPLVLAAADAARALAADDLAAYQPALAQIREVWQAYTATADVDPALADQVRQLREGPDLDTVREVFEPFSTTIADLARAAHLHHRGTVHVFQCPMTPVLGTGRWVQRDDALRNPFFGAAMLTCGEELE